MFGDDDPEDAWDAGDTFGEKLAVLERWVPSIVLERMTPHSHVRVVARIHLALDSVEGLALATNSLPILETLGHLRDRLLEAQREEGT
jgi:hypothetical protein